MLPGSINGVAPLRMTMLESNISKIVLIPDSVNVQEHNTWG
jgi:hypothetical protein